MNQENEKAEITLNENGSGLNKKSWEETTSDDECEEEVSFRLKKKKNPFQLVIYPFIDSQLNSENINQNNGCVLTSFENTVNMKGSKCILILQNVF